MFVSSTLQERHLRAEDRITRQRMKESERLQRIADRLREDEESNIQLQRMKKEEDREKSCRINLAKFIYLAELLRCLILEHQNSVRPEEILEDIKKTKYSMSQLYKELDNLNCDDFFKYPTIPNLSAKKRKSRRRIRKSRK